MSFYCEYNKIISLFVQKPLQSAIVRSMLKHSVSSASPQPVSVRWRRFGSLSQFAPLITGGSARKNSRKTVRRLCVLFCLVSAHSCALVAFVCCFCCSCLRLFPAPAYAVLCAVLPPVDRVWRSRGVHRSLGRIEGCTQKGRPNRTNGTSWSA